MTVSDVVVTNGVVSGLSCDFSPLGGPATGVTWAGPFGVGASFTCTANLTGVEVNGIQHLDIATVNGVGAISALPVTDDNPYYARRTIQVLPTSSTVAPTTTVTTPRTPAKPSLASTGVASKPAIGTALGLLVVGGGLMLLGRRRVRPARKH